MHVFPSLAPGAYTICIVTDAIPVLDPCQWAAAPPLVRLEAGQSVIRDLALEEGTFLHLRVDDPERLIKKARRHDADRLVFPRIWSAAGRPLDFVQFATSDDGYRYRVAVPRDRDVRLTLDSGDVDFEDVLDATRKYDRVPQTLRPNRAVAGGEPFPQLVFTARKKSGR